jgi:hypothetical protein
MSLVTRSKRSERERLPSGPVVYALQLAGLLDTSMPDRYVQPKIERLISLLSASPVGEARLLMPKGMAYKD